MRMAARVNESTGFNYKKKPSHRRVNDKEIERTAYVIAHNKLRFYILQVCEYCSNTVACNFVNFLQGYLVKTRRSFRHHVVNNVLEEAETAA